MPQQDVFSQIHAERQSGATPPPSGDLFDQVHSERGVNVGEKPKPPAPPTFAGEHPFLYTGINALLNRSLAPGMPEAGRSIKHYLTQRAPEEIKRYGPAAVGAAGGFTAAAPYGAPAGPVGMAATGLVGAGLGAGGAEAGRQLLNRLLSIGSYPQTSSEAASDIGEATTAGMLQEAIPAGGRYLKAKYPAAAAAKKYGAETVMPSAEKLATTRGRYVAEELGPRSTTPLQAGRAAKAAVPAKMAAHEARADVHYDNVRRIAAQPENTAFVKVGEEPIEPLNPESTATRPVLKQVQGPVQLAPVKKQLQPLWEEIDAAMPLAQKEMSPGYKALRDVMNEPDVIPISKAIDDLSALKTAARRRDFDVIRKRSAGIAAQAVTPFHDAVEEAASAMGPEALSSWNAGRAATAEKYGLLPLLRATRGEPVAVFKKLTANEDRFVDTLKLFAQEFPEGTKDLARGYFEGAVRSGKWNAWSKLGDETRALLTGNDPIKAQAVNEFFNWLQSVQAASAEKATSTSLTTFGKMLAKFAFRRVPGYAAAQDAADFVRTANRTLSPQAATQASAGPRLVERLREAFKTPSAAVPEPPPALPFGAEPLTTQAEPSIDALARGVPPTPPATPSTPKPVSPKVKAGAEASRKLWRDLERQVRQSKSVPPPP
jgi:hypothetical protein